MKMLCVPLFALLSVPVMSQADTWSIRADSWCPYNCEPSDNHSGYMIEIIELAAKSAGHKVDYKIVPWSRALVDVRLGQINGVVGASDGDGGKSRGDVADFGGAEVEVAVGADADACVG